MALSQALDVRKEARAKSRASEAFNCALRALRGIDARWIQIAIVVLLIVYAKFVLHQRIQPLNVAIFFATTLLAEYIGGRAQAKRFVALSPIITALSLSLMLRTNEPLLAAAAGLLAIGSKYMLRVQDKQVFNPSNIAIVAITVTTSSAWISVGQWGQGATIAATLAALGTLVCTRAQRLDLALTFLLSWSALLIGRAIYLGDPLAIPLHQLQDGSLVIFSFFMITDPRATPDHRGARIVFAVALSLLAYWFRFFQYAPDGLLWSLACISPLTVALDRAWPNARFTWRNGPMLTPRQQANRHTL